MKLKAFLRLKCKKIDALFNLDAESGLKDRQILPLYFIIVKITVFTNKKAKTSTVLVDLHYKQGYAQHNVKNKSRYKDVAIIR